MISSEHATYMNVPPARLVKIISTISEVFESRMPMVTPNGVAQLNKIMSFSRNLKSVNDFYNEIANEIVSAAL